MKSIIKTTIAGGAGYTGGELLRLLLLHPNVRLVSVLSTTQAGQPLWAAHRDLLGDTAMTFDSRLPQTDIDVLFLCLGHGASQKFLMENDLSRIGHIVDLSQDFRHHKNSVCNGRSFLYALPEAYPNAAVYEGALREAGNAANPGCFATAIQLALLPLASAGILSQDIHIHAITGATGAGAKPTETGHFAYRDNNISVYKAFEHQHLTEIRETLGTLAGGTLPPIYFVPVRGDFTRGILASAYTPADLTEQEAAELFEKYYAEHPFVHVVPGTISLKEAVNTNKGLVHVEKHGTMLHITSAIDNLLKGASGTAVQNMNILMGIDQTAGLKLKPTAY